MQIARRSALRIVVPVLLPPLLLSVPSAADALPTGCVEAAGRVTCTYDYVAPPQPEPFGRATQTFTVPAGVATLTVDLYGAAGANSGSATGGKGAHVSADLTVTPGTAFDIEVGGQGGSAIGIYDGSYRGGYNGGGPSQSDDDGGESGGGGGATDIRTAGGADADRLLVAGGGGGASFSGILHRSTVTGGNGGDSGGPGQAGRSSSLGPSPGEGGGAGTDTAGGTGGLSGVSVYPGLSGRGAAGTDGQLRTGGSGGANAFGLPPYGGGGGGGYYGGGGGGGGATNDYSRAIGEYAGGGGGGGGSNYVTPTATNSSVVEGEHSGHGQVVISYVSNPTAVPPSVKIDQASGQADPASSSPVLFDVKFSEEVTGFDGSDVVLSGSAGATAASVTGSGASYQVSVSGMTQSGDVIASINAAAAQDGDGNDSAASTSTDNTVAYLLDVAAPTVAINQAPLQPDPTTTSPVLFDVIFSEPVTGFDGSDVVLSGSAAATTASFTGSGATYQVSVSGMTQSGDVIASIGAGAAKDAAGNDSTASTSTDNTVAFELDSVAPTVTINQASGQADPASSSPVLFDVAFSEAVTGFEGADVALSGSAGATTASVTGSGSTYQVSVSGMTQPGDVVATIDAAAAEDATGNDSTASTSTDNTVTFDNGAPTVTINQASGQADPASAGPVLFDVEFSESVSGFESTDVQVSGTAGATTVDVTGSGSTYQVKVSGMTQAGSVTAAIGPGAAKDVAGNDAAASTSTDDTVTFQRVFTRGPTASISGLPRVGSTLTAGVRSSSPAAERVGYRWFANGVQIAGATGPSFKLTTTQHRKRITVKVFAVRTGFVTATDVSDPTSAISALMAKHILMEPDEDLVRRGQRVDLEIHGLASNEPWGLFWDGYKIGSGRADSRGQVDTTFVVPSRAASGNHRLRANGAFADRTDTDTVTVK